MHSAPSAIMAFNQIQICCKYFQVRISLHTHTQTHIYRVTQDVHRYSSSLHNILFTVLRVNQCTVLVMSVHSGDAVMGVLSFKHTKLSRDDGSEHCSQLANTGLQYTDIYNTQQYRLRLVPVRSQVNHDLQQHRRKPHALADN